MTIESLGYIGLKVSDLGAWADFATKTLGLMPTEAPEGTLRFRMDAQAWRISVEPGEEDDIAYAGLEVASADELAKVSARLSEAGVAFSEADADLLKLRGVSGLVSCQDPQGLPIEVYYGATERGELPFVSPAGVRGFVTAEQGLGHIVLTAKDIAATRGFYRDTLGFQLSDTIRMQLSPQFAMELEFYHCNPRHHTLALVPAPLPKRLNHFMIQTAELDDVGFALDRISSAGLHLSNSLGKHTNDHMVSFYVRTPSGFDVEYGWGAREIEANWRVVRHDKTSIWGHHRPQ
jgi:biphenyl-2,3-diol 1,2-dioxygenase